MEAEGEGWDLVKLALAPLPVMYCWPLQGCTFIVVLLVKRYVVYYLQMVFF